MLVTNHVRKFENYDIERRLVFREQLKTMLDEAIISQEPIVSGDFPIVNLTKEYITGDNSSKRLRDYYSFVVQPLLEERYLHELEVDENDMFRRVAKHISRDDIDQDIFYYMMKLRLFLPATPTLMNAGREKAMLSSCFSIVPEDDMESIADYWKVMSLVQKYGGGMGVGWDNIRPAGSPVGGTGGIASGWKPYFDVANHVNAAIKQGSARSGANAATMRVDHPEIFSFMDVKKDDPQKYQYFNLSVVFTDDQFRACLEGQDIELYHPKGQGKMVVDGRAILEHMASNAWKNGDPSPYFIDRANRVWNDLVLGRLDPWGKRYGPRCTHNPCGEQCLPSHGVCNLGSINLFTLVDPIDNKMHPELMENVTRAALRFLDGVVDVNWFPDERITLQSRHLRNVGLGFMGLADVFYILGMEYGDERSIQLAELTSRYMTDWAWSESLALGRVLGAAPVFVENGIEDFGYRNSDVTCIAPTGSISLLALASSGIEPYFSTKYKKLVYPKGKPDEQKFIDIIPPALMFFEHTKPAPLTAMKIDPRQHVDILSAVSRNVTNAVSKTVNLPNNYSVDDVIDIYQYAFERGCTSITIFRDGSREDLALVNEEEKDPHDWLIHVPEEERSIMLKREPFSLDKLKELEESGDPIFDEDHEMVSHSSKSFINWNSGSTPTGACLGCGSNDVRMQEGCISCAQCLWSLCSSS